VFPDPQDERRARSVTDAPLFAMLNAGACVTAAIAAAACLIVYALTFTPWARYLPSDAFVPFFVLVFPLFGWSVWLQTAARRRPDAARSPAEWLKTIPRAGQVLVALAATAAVAGGLTAAGGLGGQPQYDPATHQYSLNNHGKLTVVSRAAYLDAVAAQNRFFLSVTLIFLTAAFSITCGAWSRRRPGNSSLRGSFPLRRLPRPARPRPRVPVPAPVLALAAAGTLAVTVAGGLHIIDRVNAWNDNAIYLHAGRPVAATLAPGQYTVFAGCTQSLTCAHLDPGSVTVRGASGGASGAVDVGPDPSSDTASEGPGGGGQTFVGRLSFSIQRAGAVRIELAASPGQPVFVVPSEGQLARSLIGWIALTGAALLILLLSLTGLGFLAWWRLTPALSQFVPGAEPSRLNGGPGAS
jgi:hypothetical protein